MAQENMMITQNYNVTCYFLTRYYKHNDVLLNFTTYQIIKICEGALLQNAISIFTRHDRCSRTPQLAKISYDRYCDAIAYSRHVQCVPLIIPPQMTFAFTRNRAFLSRNRKSSVRRLLCCLSYNKTQTGITTR